MENSYINEIIRSQSICTMDTKCNIYTDRMGSLDEQNVTLAWGGYSLKMGDIAITPLEAEILSREGLLKNEDCEKTETIHVKFPNTIMLDGAIVCGILAPSTKAKLRQEIYNYAMRKGYVNDEMEPVKMLRGSKYLVFNVDGTYNVFFCWQDTEKIKKSLLEEFTRKFFSNYTVEIKGNGIVMKNLSEKEVFSKKNINLFREYDIQLFYLDPEWDKQLLLRAVMKRALIEVPLKKLQEEIFMNNGNIVIPGDRQERLEFNKFGKKSMNYGMVIMSSVSGKKIDYTYYIAAPYSERIRELMINTESVCKEIFGNNVQANFSGFDENLHITCYNTDFCMEVEREIIALDYAMTLLIDENKFNKEQLYASIISLLEADSSGRFRYEYFAYLKILQKALPHKM